MAERVPSTLRFGAVTFPVLQLGDGRLAFAWYEGSRRRVVKRGTLAELRDEGERIATGILNAETAAIEISAEERRIYIAARQALAPLAIAVDRGAHLLVEAIALAGSAEKLLAACRLSAATASTCPAATTGEVVTHLLRHLSADGVKANYYRPLEADLNRFATRFPVLIAECRNSEMEDWLRDMKLPGGEPISARRRRNYRDKLVRLFNFAQEKGYLPQNVTTEAQKVARPKVKRKAPPIYTPIELDLLLQQCLQPADRRSGRRDYANFLPSVAIGAFAGLRWEEIRSLDWQLSIHWENGVIEVGDENKTGHRIVPMEANLVTWLTPYKDRTGPVCPYDRPDNIIRRLGMRAGLPVGGRRYSNALRHSCVTYKVAVTKNMAEAAIFFGHSVAELKQSYYRPQLEKIGKAWFAIQRPEASNVVQMPLLSFGSR